MRGLAVAGAGRRGRLGPGRRAGAAAVAAGCVGGLQGRHHPVCQRAGRADESLHRPRHDLAGAQDVALDRVVDAGAGQLALEVLRDRVVVPAGAPARAPLQVDGAELPRREQQVPAEQPDDAGGVGALLQLRLDELLVAVREVDRGLGRGHALARHHHGLQPGQELVVAVEAGGRGDGHPAGGLVDGDDRPGGCGRQRRQRGQQQRQGRCPPAGGEGPFRGGEGHRRLRQQGVLRRGRPSAGGRRRRAPANRGRRRGRPRAGRRHRPA